MADRPFRVSVWITTRAERDLATAILSRTDPQAVHLYDGLVTGPADEAVVRELAAAGLRVDRSSGTPDNPPPRTLPGLAATVEAALEDSPVVAALLRRAAELPAPAVSPWLRAGARLLASVAPPLRFAGVPLGALRRGVTSMVAWLEPPAVFEIQLMGPMRPEWAEVFRANGVRVTSYAPPYRYRATLTPEQEKALRAEGAVASIAPYSLRDTLSASFVQHLAEAEDRPASTPSVFDLAVHAPEQAALVRGMIETSGQGTVEAESGRFLRLRAPALSPLVAALAGRTEVESIAPYRPPALFCEFGRALIGAPAVVQAPGGPWDGAGEVIGLLDSGVDAGHPDLADRIQSYATVPGATAEDLFGHGTHVAGILCGTGKASATRTCGVAPGARLAVVGIVDAQNQPLLPPDLGPLLAMATDQGAKILNLSLGFPENRYDQYAETVDQFVLDHPDVLVVVAAGNRGAASQGLPAINTLASPATAKNALTVGACVSDRPGFATTWKQYEAARFGDPPIADDRMTGPPIGPAALSSRGPTEFLSIKPDLVAPGTYILSARAAKGTLASYAPVPPEAGPYIYLNGTSMAAPFAAGAAALLRHYLRGKMGVAEPSAALLKALLVCAAVRGAAAVPQVGYPDFDQGAGRLDLSAILPETDGLGPRLAFVDVADGSAAALQSRVPPQSPRRANRLYQLGVAAGGSPLRVVLAWTDTPGIGLQNVLKLEVRGPGVSLLGNHEHTFAPDPLFPFDHKNNVQVVNVESAAAGEYSVSVLADNTPLPGRFQGYALAVSGRLAGGLSEEAPAF